jgi:hypothetical protein
MKRAEPHSRGSFAYTFRDPPAHFVRGFVGEREAENAFSGKLRIVFKQQPNPFGDDTRLSSPGTGDYKKRTFTMFSGNALLRIQIKFEGLRHAMGSASSS